MELLHKETLTVVAEIGAVHVGNLDRAKELVRLAASAGADVAKFQKRNPHESVPEHLKHKPHPNQSFAYGPTYLEHRLALEFNADQHRELKEFCEATGIEYSTSVWDMTSAKEMAALRPRILKVPSACNNNYALIDWLLDNHDGDIHISLGMTTAKERDAFTNRYLPAQHRLVVYHCTSCYPCSFDKLYLSEISSLCSVWPRVGFSNHGYGIAADVAALALGATYFERHFVDDRSFPHTDARSSLEVPGLMKLCRDLSNVAKSLRSKPEGLDEDEAIQRAKLRV